jgi:hypothetical protein
VLLAHRTREVPTPELGNAFRPGQARPSQAPEGCGVLGQCLVGLEEIKQERSRYAESFGEEWSPSPDQGFLPCQVFMGLGAACSV